LHWTGAQVILADMAMRAVVAARPALHIAPRFIYRFDQFLVLQKSVGIHHPRLPTNRAPPGPRSLPTTSLTLVVHLCGNPREILEGGRVPGRLLLWPTKLWKTCRCPPRLVRPKWAGSISTSPECGGWPRRCWRYELRRQGSWLPNWLRKCAS